MPQETNFNVSPYFDDFDQNKNYYKVLFKPGFPIQARELTTLQSILQNQIEKFGNHIFKEGSVVIPGQTIFNSYYNAVELNEFFLGISVSSYIKDLIGVKIKGQSSGIIAIIENAITSEESDRNNPTIFVSYINANANDNESFFFNDGEILLIEDLNGNFTSFFNENQQFSSTISSNSHSFGSSFSVSEGVYYLRGHFIGVKDQTIILDQYSNSPSYKIGFTIIEDIIDSSIDDSLNDNARGFSNFSAPGADRLQIFAQLDKKPLTEDNSENFIEIAQIERGKIRNRINDSDYNLINDKLAERTFDESGNYYINRFNVSLEESLNDNEGNNGIFSENSKTYQDNFPSEDLAVYKISPGKAYVRGYQVEVNSSTFLDIEKPRDTKNSGDESIIYSTGPSLSLNRVVGSPIIGIGTNYTVSLRNKRIGEDKNIASGDEIGLARVFDFSLEEGSYNTIFLDSNRWNLSLYDVQSYTKIILNQPITLSASSHFVGNSSGATGFLKNSVNNNTEIILYNVNGKFLSGESFTIDSINNNRISLSVVNYDISDVKSIFSNDSGSVFNSDTILTPSYSVGISSITSESSGISTIVIPGTDFFNKIEISNILRFTNPTNPQVPNYVEVLSKDTNNFSTFLTIVGVATVFGVCEGKLPDQNISVTDLTCLNTSYLPSSNSRLFTPLSKQNVSNINLDNSSIIIRKNYNISIGNTSTEIIVSAEDEFFMPYDEERYSLVSSDGIVEPLSSDKFIFDNGGKSLQIVGLTTTNTTAKLIATLKKINVKSKVKKKKRVETITVDRSVLNISGIGSNTNNDGLIYGTFPYGTRVQDKEISLNYPDILRIYGIYESNDSTSDPFCPSLVLSSINSQSSTTSEFIVGEKIKGLTSNSVAIVAEKISSNIITILYLNDSEFIPQEIIESQESKINASINLVRSGSKEISNSFTFDNGQRETFYDYGRIIRKENFSPPIRKIKIYFDRFFYDEEDTGDITTVNSYKLSDYKNDIIYFDGFRMSDILDIRPRVSNYNLFPGARSPFEFSGRLFDQKGNSASNILCSDESIVLNYDFYLPRIDKIFVNKNSEFIVQKGVSDETPKPPNTIEDSLEIAEIFLPPYLYDVNRVSIKSFDYKRYQMSDISKIETRVKNLEYYTTLSLLESETSNMNIFDSNGINRFKSGFFVDNFTSLKTQEERIGIRNSIDPFLGQLRPSHYTSSVDLLLSTKTRIGVGLTSNEDIKNVQTEDILGFNIKKSGDIITLDYSDVEFIRQPYATKVENIQPYALVFWEGSLKLNPSSDIWVDTVRLEAKTIQVEGDYLSTVNRLQLTSGLNPQTGLGPVIWGSWSLLGYGNPRWLDARQERFGGGDSQAAVRNRFNEARRTGNTINPPQWIGGSGQAVREGVIPTTGLWVQVVDALYQRSGTQLQVRERFDIQSLGDSIVSVDIQPFIRSRNIQFRANNLKPNSRMFAFFDGKDVTSLCFPKLVEITMQSGVFSIGERVTIRKPGSDVPEGFFRVSSPDHKEGIFNNPSKKYTKNPYFPSENMQKIYTSTSNIINVDVDSMSINSQSSFYGIIKRNYILTGDSSKAIALVTNSRLITDNSGDIIGSFHIPDPNKTSNFKFSTGVKSFRLTSDKENKIIPGSGGTFAENNYFAEGKTQKIQEKLISIRNAEVSNRVLSQRRTEEQFTGLYIDPLAQSFACDEPSGIFLTKLEVFFQKKDSSLPVTCQIRTMDLGIPTQTVLPFSEVSLSPDEVNTSNDASVATEFKFESPVYLEGNKEYAIILLSQSTSYFVWISSILSNDNDFSPSIDTLTGERVTTQPILGSLFKSQNALTWTPSQFEDLKFTLYRAEFNTNSPGNVNFYNPDLNIGNAQVPILTNNPLDFISRRLRIRLSDFITDDDSIFTVGSTVLQESTNSTGIYSEKVGIATGDNSDGGLSIDNPGIGYFPISGTETYPSLTTKNILSNGKDLTLNVTVVNGSVTQVSVNNGGYGYKVGDLITIPQIGDTNLGRNLKISIGRIDEFDQIVLSDVSGDFNPGVGVGNTIKFINSSGDLVELNSSSGGNVTIVGPIDIDSDGLHFRVLHQNHGMHSPLNYVRLSNVSPDTTSSVINQDIDKSFTGFLSVENSEVFDDFEGIPVSPINPGYAIIEGEVVKYTSSSGGFINIISRGIDSTNQNFHSIGSEIKKYEINGVSLLRINKLHRLESSLIDNSIGLDYYTLRIDQSANSEITNRTPSSSLGKSLYFRTSKFDGGNSVRASQNMQFEVLTPIVETFTPNQTNISSSVRTISGRSISGNEISFLDRGIESITLGEYNYFSTPRIICSIDNEQNLLSQLPANKSLSMNLTLTSNDSRITPCIDLNRVSVITTTNRVNKIIDDNSYQNDGRIKSLDTDQNAFLYVTKQIRLQNPASSIKLYVSADINDYCDIRAMYSISNEENAEPIFNLFPGFNNLNNLLDIINPEMSDGRPDRFTEKTPILSFEGQNYIEYEFTANNLPSFTYYRIKLIMTSTNQSYVPKIKDIRAIALA